MLHFDMVRKLLLVVLILAAAGCTSSQEQEQDQEMGVAVDSVEVQADTIDVAGVWDGAREAGIDFRAVGQEPGWLLEIREGTSIRFAYDYATQEIEVPFVEPEVVSTAPQKRRYESGSGGSTLFVSITDSTCADIMSGQIFESTVEVQLDSTLYHGCGRAL